MKKPFLILVILLLVSMISMVWMSPVSSVDSTELSVSPLNTIDYTLQPKPVQRINATDDGTFTDWTNNTLTVRPNAPEGTYSDWSGRILTLRPNDHGTFSEWSSWVYLRPDANGNYTAWTGIYSYWDDWPDHDGDTAYSYCYTTAANFFETSTFENPPTEPRDLSINKVRLTMVARNTGSVDAGYDLNVSARVYDASWDGWTRWGSTPWLNASDYPTHYIGTSVKNDPIGNFAFQDVPSGLPWNNTVKLRIKAWTGNNDDIEISLYNGASWSTYPIIQLTTTPSYVSVDVSSFLDTVGKINDAQLRIKKITDGSADNVFVDHACLRLYGQVQMMLSGVINANVDGRLDDAAWDGWTRVPTGEIGPWLNAPDYPTNYINSSANGDKIGNFTFQDVPSGITWGTVTLRLRTWQSSLGNDQLKIYLYDGSVWSTAYTVTPLTIVGSYRDIPVSTFLNTVAKINAAQMRIEKVTSGTADNIFVDYAYLLISGLVYGGNTYSLTTTYTSYISEWSTHPLTGSTWTWSDIVDLQAGVRSALVKSWVELRVTQLYISVLTSGLYTYLDEWPDHNGDTDYSFATAGTKLQSSALPDSTGETWSILKVKVYIVARETAADATVQPILVVGGTAYTNSTASSLTTSYTEISVEWYRNPGWNNNPWNWTAIDALQAGVKSVTASTTAELRVTQLFVKVMEAGTYQNWDEATQDGDATYNSAVSGGLSRSSQLQDHTSETWPIARVQVNVVARADMDIFPLDTERERIRIMLVIGGIRYYSPDIIISYYNPLTQTETATQYSTYSYVWTTNPAWTPGWNWSAIDALQAGVNSVQVGTAWKGEIRVTQLYVVVGQDGTYTEWDEPTQNGDTDYVSATMKDMQESSVLNITSPTPSWDIARVRVVFYARVTETTDEKVAPIVVIGGSPYAGTEYTPTTSTSYAKYTGDWGKNPVTGDYWTWSDIDSLEAGVMSLMGVDGIWVGEIRVTQLYVEVAGPRFMVYVEVTSVTDLYGFEFFLNYSTDVLTAASISSGGWFPLDSMEYLNIINDDLGYIRYSVTMPLGSPSGMTGSGKLANITFFPDSYGSSVLDLWNTKLRDRYATPISHVIEDGYFNNKIIGDVDANRKVDGFDLFDVGKAYDTAPSQPNWNIECDFNRDDKVNATDLSDLSTNYGTSV